MEFTFDFASLGIGGVALAILIFGLTEAFKEFTGLTGKPVRGFVAILGTLFVFLVVAREKGVMSDDVWLWVEVITRALAGGVAAMGYYAFQKNK